MAYLTGSGLKGLKTYLITLFTKLSLFTDYLLELHFNAHGGLSNMWHLFGNQTGEIINELSDTLAE
jgi:hypothetical protein